MGYILIKTILLIKLKNIMKKASLLFMYRNFLFLYLHKQRVYQNLVISIKQDVLFFNARNRCSNAKELEALLLNYKAESKS